MEDYENVTSFNAKGREFKLFAVYDGHGGRDPKTAIKKGGKEVALWCLNHLPAVIKNTVEMQKVDSIQNALIESFKKADKGKFPLQSHVVSFNLLNYFIIKQELLETFPENVGATAIVILIDVVKKTIYFVC
jgi:serine/threonine protein phosphatase PrpC